MVDEYSGMKISSFHDTKNGIVEPTWEIFENWRQNVHPVKFIQCDSGGENVNIESRAKRKDWNLNLEFEYTGKDTLQRNHMAELGLATIGGRGREMMHYANVPMEDRYMVCKEALMTETRLYGPIVVVRSGKTATRY